jgi:PAT family beta-lactamase induction signal transducer AmpG
MSGPVLYLLVALTDHQWILPNGLAGTAKRVAQGLMYGTRSASFMAVTDPAVAANQFTAYMAMMNLAVPAVAAGVLAAQSRLAWQVLEATPQPA